MLNHKGAMATHSCVLCFDEQRRGAANRKQLGPKAIGERNFDANEPGMYGLPLFPFTAKQIIPPVFHILMGLGQRVIDSLQELAKSAGNGDQFEEYLRQQHCFRDARKKNFTGQNGFKNSEKILISGKSIQKIVAEPHCTTLTNFVPAGDARDIFWLLIFCLKDIQALSHAAMIDQENLDKLRAKTKQLFERWQRMGQHDEKAASITIKLHLLCAHLPIFAEQRGFFSLVSEQAIEHQHALINNLVFLLFIKFLKINKIAGKTILEHGPC